ncbi:MAG: carotenoid 1,2-hydratase [Caulobacteraceae bacterium]|nr:carotenoid 1,2-hydratase [Caulobacter sp.]
MRAGGSEGPDFARPVGPDGYAWWYVDALSADGRRGLTLIAFVGSVFSPYYFAARQAGPADPLEHCALNVCLYEPGAGRWRLTERGAADVERSAERLAIGPSTLEWGGDGLTVRIDEAARGKGVRGRLRVAPDAVSGESFTLHPGGGHLWRPLAPTAEVELELEEPAARFRGRGYFDMNWGARPLERDFRTWSWARVEQAKGAAVLFDTRARNGRDASLALRFDRGGGVQRLEPPPPARLSRTLCQLPRPTRADPGARPRVLRTLEDTPFYARSAIRTRLWGEEGVGMHETLDLDRFASGWMQRLLPYRMPREPLAEITPP